MRYLLHVPKRARGTGGRRRHKVVIASKIHVRHQPIMRRKRQLGPFNELEATGKLRPEYQVIAVEGRTDRGQKVERSRDRVEVAPTAAAVKKSVRKLREQEAERLDRIDELIQRHHEAINELRDEREDIAAEAWQKGNVVRLGELEDAKAQTVADDETYRIEQEAKRAEYDEGIEL